MRNNKTAYGRTFYNELTPLANAIRAKTQTPPRLSGAKDVPALLDKKAAKLKRRAEAARKAGLLL